MKLSANPLSNGNVSLFFVVGFWLLVFRCVLIRNFFVLIWAVIVSFLVVVGGTRPLAASR